MKTVQVHLIIWTSSALNTWILSKCSRFNWICPPTIYFAHPVFWSQVEYKIVSFFPELFSSFYLRVQHRQYKVWVFLNCFSKKHGSTRTNYIIGLPLLAIRHLKHDDAFNTTWPPVLSIDKCCQVTSLSTERTDHHVLLKASSCLRCLLTIG